MPNENLKVRGVQRLSRHASIHDATIADLVTTVANCARNRSNTSDASDYVLAVGGSAPVAKRAFPNKVIYVEPAMLPDVFKDENVCVLAFNDADVAAVAFHGLCYVTASRDGSLWRMYNVPAQQTAAA